MKMRKLIIKSMLAGSLLAMLPACEKLEDFGGTNNNPNATTAPNTAGPSKS